MTNQATTPADILPDNADHLEVNGLMVRKGTVAAFISNIRALENPTSSAYEKEKALKMMKELAPAIVALGLQHHITFKNEQAEQIIQQAAQNQ